MALATERHGREALAAGRRAVHRQSRGYPQLRRVRAEEAAVRQRSARLLRGTMPKQHDAIMPQRHRGVAPKRHSDIDARRYTENKRFVCELYTEHFGMVVMVVVGATARDALPSIVVLRL